MSVPHGDASESRPPVFLTLKWCDRCRRNDRWTPLKDRHFTHGKLCPGTVHTSRYRLDESCRCTTEVPHHRGTT